jgi:hypothetical protein
VPTFPSGLDEPLSLALARLPPHSFFRRFVDINQLYPITHFLFLAGMLFNDDRLWWGGKKTRPHRHEGIDIYLMQDINKQLANVAAHMLVPAVLPGQPVHFHRDFLGETIYIQHPEIRQDNAILHTLYGHVSSLAGFTPIHKGQPAGKISLPETTVPAHLHISCAWIRDDQQMDELNWNTIARNDNIVFIDPFPFLLR